MYGGLRVHVKIKIASNGYDIYFVWEHQVMRASEMGTVVTTNLDRNKTKKGNSQAPHCMLRVSHPN